MYFYLAMVGYIYIHLLNVLTDHLNILAYIKAWLMSNNKMKLLLLYYNMTWKIHF